MRLWNKVVINSTHLYPHTLHKHLADFLRGMPIDPFFLMTQGLEHCHKWRKAVHLRATNYMKPSKKRKKDGSMLRSRTPQALSFCVAMDDLTHDTYDESKANRKMQKMKESMVKRAKAKQERLGALASIQEN